VGAWANSRLDGLIASMLPAGELGEALKWVVYVIARASPSL
jgi:hypothetical protein